MHQTDASIIIPTRNRAAWLPTCLAHLEQQTFPAARFEVVVADIASSDDTLSVLERYAQGSPVRIRALPLGPVGFAAARNRAVRAAEGRLVLFLADDELASPRLLERHWEAHQTSSRDCCFFGEINPHPQLPQNTFTRLFISEPPPEDEYTELVPFLDAQTSNTSLSCSLFEHSGGFPEDETIRPLEHLIWAHHLFKTGVPTSKLSDSRSYVWQPADLDSERVRLYDVGYGLYHVLCLTHSSAIVNRYHLRQGKIEQSIGAFFLPFYLRACRRQDRENPVFTGALYRRILALDRARGFNDARLGRPRRPPATPSPATGVTAGRA